MPRMISAFGIDPALQSGRAPRPRLDCRSMDFRDTPEEAAFRQHVRDWLASNLPHGWGTPEWREPEGVEATVAFHKEWSQKVYEAGLVGLSWPKKHGGHEAPLTH